MKSELLKRTGVAVLAIPIALVAAYFGGWFFTLIVAAMGVAVSLEIQDMAAVLNRRGTPLPGALFCAVVPMIVHLYGPSPLLTVLLVFVLILGGVAVVYGVGKGLNLLLINLLSALMVGLPLAGMVLIRDADFGFTPRTAGGVIIFIWAGAWFSDTCAYLVGRKIGRIKLAPRLSPKKTVEGGIAGLFGALLWGLFAAIVFAPFFPIVDRVWIGLIIGVFGTFGDLLASLVKREAGVKDSGRMFPGHGGAYDRFDSIIFISGAVWLYLAATGYLVLP